MKDAPAFAANIAWEAEKHSVTFTKISWSLKLLQVLRPSIVKGTFTATFFAIDAKYFPSSNMVLWSVAVTSALTGPSTKLHISGSLNENTYSNDFTSATSGIISTNSTADPFQIITNG